METDLTPILQNRREKYREFSLLRDRHEATQALNDAIDRAKRGLNNILATRNDWQVRQIIGLTEMATGSIRESEPPPAA
jgi:hypothetical protein